MEEKGREGGAPPANAATITTIATTSATATTVASRAPEVVVVEQVNRRRAGALKRKANNTNTSGNSSTSSKRLAKEKSLFPLPSLHNGPCTRARQSPNKLAAAAAAGSIPAVPQKLDEPVFPPASSAVGEVIIATEESNADNEAWQALEPVIDAEFEAIRSRDANVHVVPSPAGWFSWTKIHPLEERVMAPFFNGKSEKRTPDIYIEIRNSIVRKFHADPKTQIELKDLSELSVGELDVRQEVMEFLDHWGLINFHPFPPNDSAAANAETDGAAKMASLIEKLYQFETVQNYPRFGPRTDLSTPAMPPRLFPEAANPTIADDLVRPEGPAYHCNSCSADCSRKRYHCQKQADFDLCSECYSNGKFGSGMSPADFILMEPAEVPGINGGSWTDQETLLLLEALELYGENWNEIAEHVATKTKAQCILHFVQMPIEDTFLEGEDDFDASLQGNIDSGSTNDESSALKVASETTEGKSAANEEPPVSSPMDMPKPKDADEVKIVQEIGADRALNALKEAFQTVGSLPGPGGILSFSEAGNPVMALAAFLTRLTETDVAAASARSSLKAISEGSGIHLAARHCFILEDPPEDRKEPPVSERAVDDMVDGEPLKDENQNEEHQKEEIQISVFDVTDTVNDCTDKKIEDVIPEEKETLVSPSDECPEKLHTSKEHDDLTTEEDASPSTVKESTDTILPGKDPPSMGKDSPSTIKDSGDLALSLEVTASSTKESVDVASVEEVPPCSEVSKAVDMVLDLVPLEEKESQQPVTSTSTVETGADAGEDDTKLVDCKNEKNCNLTETKDDHNTDRIKHTVITALSAAAVKAKLLANQEEEQIRQLATLLIEKQLHKLETKLSFFTEMESVILRSREQMDRSRQKLYSERSQIIAARFALSASSSSRVMPPSLPTSRTVMNHASMMPQKPPLKRTMMTSAPSLSNIGS